MFGLSKRKQSKFMKPTNKFPKLKRKSRKLLFNKDGFLTRDEWLEKGFPIHSEKGIEK